MQKECVCALVRVRMCVYNGGWSANKRGQMETHCETDRQTDREGRKEGHSCMRGGGRKEGSLDNS